MDMTGEQRIEAPRDKVWAALNDPEVLKQCIPGCQSLEKVADDRMRAVAQVKVGPIGARFTGEVALSDLDPPNGYRIQGEGQGGAAGFAKGGATVRLREDGAATILAYEASAQVGGKLAQLGGAIIDATAKSMAAAFFKRLSEVVAPAPAAAPEPAPQPSARSAAQSASQSTAAAASTTSAASAHADAPRPQPPAPAAAPKPAARPPLTWMLAVVIAALVGILIGRGGADGGSTWAALAIGLLLVVIAYAAFEAGRRTGAPTVILDAGLLARLAAEAEESRS